MRASSKGRGGGSIALKLVGALSLAAAAAVAGLTASPARADADPPSDFLLYRSVYLPFFGGKPSDSAARELQRTVSAAKKAGYPIKVAVIGSRSDLGGVPKLWGKPKTYAPFLGRELAFVYKGRLLVAMPAGLAFYWRGHTAKSEQRLLDRQTVSEGADGLVTSAADAVRSLAAAEGHKVAAQSGDGGGDGGGSSVVKVLLVVAGVVAVIALVAVPLVLRSRRRTA